MSKNEKSGAFGKFLLKLYTERRRLDTSYFIALASSVILALIVGAVIILCIGKNPLVAYAEMIKGAFGKPRLIADTFAQSAMLCLTGIAMTIAARAGVFNVGGEGQLYMGGLVSAAVGIALSGVHPVLALPIIFCASALAGALYASIPAVLKVKLNISEVIVTILLNSAAIAFCTYLVASGGPLHGDVSVGTNKFPSEFRLTALVPSSKLTASIYVVAIITLLSWYFLTKTSGGYEYKITGINSEFSRYSGLKDNRISVMSMLLSGAICGVCGMFLVYAEHRFTPNLSNGLYFDGMLVAMIMRYNPIGIVFMSIFFGMMKSGATQMQSATGISAELILVLQSIIIFFMAAERGITEWLSARKKLREMRNQTGGAENE